jgi:hypothetical protein
MYFSQVREATLCIENNIREACGEQAKELVHLLVKPTVVGSAQCIYNIVDEVYTLILFSQFMNNVVSTISSK